MEYHQKVLNMKSITKSKLIFVTGASRGIGASIADMFASKGHHVVYGYHQTPITNPKVFSVKVDISSRKSIKKAIDLSYKHFGKNIDVLVNNAAIAQEKTFLNITDDDWAKMLDINLQGAFRFTQEVLPNMIKNNWGRIINITSIGGQWGGFNQVHYAASKAALINFTQSIAKIYSLYGITSNAIAPGLVATEMSANELATQAGQEKLKNIPINRLGKKEEIASIAYFLASNDASYITGQTINANGGMYFG